MTMPAAIYDLKQREHHQHKRKQTVDKKRSKAGPWNVRFKEQCQVCYTGIYKQAEKRATILPEPAIMIQTHSK
jgi:hypothetical protein